MFWASWVHAIYCDIYFFLPSVSDILRYILSCRAIAIYDLPINLRYIYKRVSPLLYIQPVSGSLWREWRETAMLSTIPLPDHYCNHWKDSRCYMQSRSSLLLLKAGNQVIWWSSTINWELGLDVIKLWSKPGYILPLLWLTGWSNIPVGPL